MSKKYTETDIKAMLTDIFSELEKNYSKKKGKKIKTDDVYALMKDADDLMHVLYDMNYIEAGKLCRKSYIALLDLLVGIEKKQDRQIFYYKNLEEAYRMSARTNFEHFVIYYEWEEEDKFFEPRYPILHAYAYYLNRMIFDPNFNLLIVNLPSGTGKTYLEKLSEAFGFGVDPTGTCLYLCSNDDVVKGGSRTVLEIMKNERFGNVFPNMRYSKEDRDYFLKETEAEWKLRDCKLVASYYAKTTQSNVVGCRASRTIHIDDLYADYKEALDENLNVYYYNKYVSVWRKRYIQNKTPKVIITGTMWSPTDFIVKVISLAEHEQNFVPHPKFRYVRVNETKPVNGVKKLGMETQAIIQIPALDYYSGESTCKNLWTTEQLIKERSSMDTYLWETNFQQRPTSPEGLEFDWRNIRRYSRIPENTVGATYAVIDGTRKSGKDFFSMPIFQPHEEDFILIDCIFTKTATTELIGDIVNKIIEHNVKILVVETNVDGGLKKVILDEFLKRNIECPCTIIEKYNTVPKATRIELEKGNIKKKIIFPVRTYFPVTSDMGKFMENFTLYNSQGRNKNDDAPDSLAMFTSEIISGKAKPQKAKAIRRMF